MDWKKDKLQSIWKPNKEKLIFLFCSGLLLFILAIPNDGPKAKESGSVSVSGETGAVGNGSTGGETEEMSGWEAAGEGADGQGSFSAAVSGSGAAGSSSYETELEERIKEILKGVDGVGEVDVMVVLKSSEEKVIHVDKNTSSSVTEEQEEGNVSRVVSSQQLSESTVLDGQTSGPIVEKSIRPEISGIVISADGGGSAVVQTEISEAMEALFGLPAHKIKVLKRVK